MSQIHLDADHPLLKKIKQHYKDKGTAYELTPAERSDARALVHRGLAFYSMDYAHVMAYSR